ncbi:hypothetical protein T439DRAFT_357160 [Meredithblackwellia eburnea MCA 4105]
MSGTLLFVALTSLLFATPSTSAALNPDEWSRLSPKSIAALQEIADEHADSTTIWLYCIPTYTLWAIMYFSAKATERGLARYTKSFSRLSFPNQRTSVMYILNVFYTTVALGVQIMACSTLREDYTVTAIRCLKTIFITSFLCTAAERTRNPSIFVTATCWIFQATTEQPIFIGLLFYRFRLSPKIVPNVLRIAALQALVVKFVFSVYVFVWYGLRQAKHHTSPLELAYTVIVVLAMSTLMFTQFYGSWIVWVLAASYKKKYAEWKSKPAAEGNGSTSSAIPIYRAPSVISTTSTDMWMDHFEKTPRVTPYSTYAYEGTESY